MIVGTLKNYILQEESVEGYKIRVMRLDSSDFVELEIKKDDAVVVRKRMDNLEKAKQFIKNLKNKFKKNPSNKKFNLKNNKEARINSDNPKAFAPGSPSEQPFMGDGPGGLLNHIKVLKDKKKNPYNRRNKRTRGREKWDETSGREKNDQFQLSRWGPENGPSRDSGPDRDGFERALEKEREGHRPALPKGEDSIDLMENPDNYNPIYDSGYPGDRITEQDVNQKTKHREIKQRQKQLQDINEKDMYMVVYRDSGEKRKLVDLTFQDATEKLRKHPGAKIVKQI